MSRILRPRPRRRTARLRLTLIYSGGFLVLGIVLIALIYAGSATVDAVTVRVSPSRPGLFVTPASIPSSGTIHGRVDDRLLVILLVAFALTAAGGTAIAYLSAGRVLAPLRNMTEAARAISASNLSRRLALAGPEDEFKALGDTLDGLLARLEAAFEAQRRFVANAAHELRTPLTLERTLLQVALADPDASAATLRATCEELLVCGREQERLLEGLLTLASSERGLERREPLELALLAERALLDARPEIKRRRLSVNATLASAPASGDPALMLRMLANLIDNAVHYNHDGGELELATAVESGHASVRVSNSGAPVSCADVERLLEPFERLEPARLGGGEGHHGLGLSIVRAIAAAHDATLQVHPNANGGLTVTVSLPAASAA